MSTTTGCVNTTSALRRPPPIADGVALRGQNRASRPPRHPLISPRIVAISHRRNVRRRFSDRLAPSRPPAVRPIPIAALASPNDSGACRGFLPRGLCDACPRGVIAAAIGKGTPTAGAYRVLCVPLQKGAVAVCLQPHRWTVFSSVKVNFVGV
jgi:hypothetical protein